MRVGLQVFLRDGIAYGVCRHHALIVVGVLLEVAFQHQAEDGCALTVSRDDERTAVVIVLKVVVQCGGNVGIGYAGKRRIDVSVLLKGFKCMFQTALTVEWDKQVGGFLEHARLDCVLDW